MAGSVWNRIKRAFAREGRDVQDAVAEATRRGHEVMDEKERELAATPEERLAMEAERAGQADAEFEALKREIEGR